MANEKVDTEAASPMSEGEGLLSPGTQDLPWEQENVQFDSKRHSGGRKRWRIAFGILALWFIYVVGFLLLKSPFEYARVQGPEHVVCKYFDPSHLVQMAEQFSISGETGMARAEWRTLPINRRHAYLMAVQRLSTLPSRLGLNATLYDDFTYVHIQLAFQVHHAALSLPWHRYFLHVYETILREEGGFDGYLP